MIARFLVIAATLVLLSACSSSDEQLADSAGAGGTAAGAGIGTTDTTGLGSPTDLGAGAVGTGAAGAMGPGTQHDLEVNVGDRVYFGYDSSILDDQSRATVERQAAWLQQFPAVTVTIEGHTDQRGTTEYNLALGERRANAVKQYLTSLNIDPARVLVISYGKERLANPAETEQAYAENRRAVTVVNITATN